MVNGSGNLTKVCSFCASDWHLITMLLPHINRAVDKGAKITTILEQNEQDKVETLLKSLQLANTDKILNIGWTRKELSDIRIKRKSTDIKMEIIISGSEEYIDEANEKIKAYIEENEGKTEIKIINCYYIKADLNIKKILQEHKAVLNTAGEKTVEEYAKDINLVG